MIGEQRVIQKICKVTGVGLLLCCLSLATTAEDSAPVFSQKGDLVGLLQSDSGHVYNREHTLPGDPGFENNIYVIRVAASNIEPRNVTTAWLFCLNADRQRIGRIRNANFDVMGSRLDATIGSTVLQNKIHVGYLCDLPIDPDQRAGPTADDVAFAEVVLVDHGRPVEGIYLDAKGDEMEGVMLQLMTRPEEDPFCNGIYRPKRRCSVIASGAVPLHRHPQAPPDPRD